jgi:hypothetical protein
MSTFVQLCQDVARESGTVSGVVPQTVTGQTGRLAKFVYWTREAWVRIQNLHTGWHFLRKTFSADTIVGQGVYTPASWSINDHAGWIVDNYENGYFPTTIYEKAVGVSDEGPILHIDWEMWRTRYGRGSQTNNRPTEYAVSPAQELVFGAIPDKIYTVRGEYIRSPQVLAANGDTPIMPARFHQIVVWRALLLLQENDEAELRIAAARVNYDELLYDLLRDQLPRVRIGADPLA